MARKKKGIPGLSFSWKRALGISSAKQSISRSTGVPLTRSGRQRKVGKAMGCSVALLILGGSIGITAVAAWIAVPAHAQTSQNLADCRSKLKAAAKLDLITDMSFSGGKPKLAIGPTWYSIDFNAKEGLARTAACFFLAGDPSTAITFPITDGRTGKKVATWKYTKLVAE